MDLTDTNQRVLLHRARAKVRAAVEAHLRSVSQHDARQIACREVLELISGYLDGALARRRPRRDRGPRAGCDGCTMVLEEFRETIAMTGELTEEQLTAAQRDTLLGAFRGWAG